MKILLQLGTDKFPDDGPAAKRMKIFYEVLKSKGHEVYVLAPEYENAAVDNPNIYLCKVPPLKDKSAVNRLLNNIGFGFSSFFKSFCIRKIDVVISTSPPALISPFGWLIAKFKHAKLVYDVRDIWPDVAWEMGSFDNRSMYSKVFEFVRNFMLKHSDLVTTVSVGKTEKLHNYSPKTPIVNIPNGIDELFLENQEKCDLIEKYHLGEKFSCVYIGNLGLAQGLKQLLYVAKKTQENHMDVQFLFFGKGAEEKILKDYADENRLSNVLFPGVLPNADVYTILKHSELSFVSLVNENLKDSIPTKMFEALGVGCPVLLAAAGESADILTESKLGIAVRPNDEAALWEAFLTIYNKYDKIVAHRDYAQRYIYSNYSRQKAVAFLEQELTNRFEK